VITPRLCPELKILPTSPQIAVTYWSIMAQLAQDLASPTPRSADAAPAATHTYLDTLMARLSAMHGEALATMHVAGEAMAERVLKGGRIHPWSGQDWFYIEAANTAGGIRGNYPLAADPGAATAHVRLDPATLTEADIIVLAAGEATPEAEIEMARQCKERGALVVGIYPFEREDGISTEELQTLCDFSIDNHSGDDAGVLAVDGYDAKIIPTAGMMNNYAHWAVIGAYVQAMEARDVGIHYWKSNHVPGGQCVPPILARCLPWLY